MAEQQDDKQKADSIVMLCRAEAHTIPKMFSMPAKAGGRHFYVSVVVLKVKTMAYPSLVDTYAWDQEDVSRLDGNVVLPHMLHASWTWWTHATDLYTSTQCR